MAKSAIAKAVLAGEAGRSATMGVKLGGGSGVKSVAVQQGMYTGNYGGIADSLSPDPNFIDISSAKITGPMNQPSQGLLGADALRAPATQPYGGVEGMIPNRSMDTPRNYGDPRTHSPGIPMGDRGMPAMSYSGPSMTSRVNPVSSINAGVSGASAAGMSTLAMAGMGAAAGGVTSYMTGGNFGQGAVAGGLMGAGMGMGGAGMLRRGAIRGVAAAQGRGGSAFGSSYSRKLATLTRGMENPANRAMLFGGGGMLGGLMFGGNRSHKRGFNSKRGNSIGR